MAGEALDTALSSFPPGSLAVVCGATGGIGKAVLEGLGRSQAFAALLGLSRTAPIRLDLEEEGTIAAAAEHIAGLGIPLRLVFDATGFLHDRDTAPEKTFRAIDPAAMARSFAVNAIGPALLMKHFLPLFPRQGKAVFATLSAKVGSLSDNRLGGWTSYRASKAALNQIVRTVSIELKRTRPHAVIAALHPGTVRTQLSQPFRGEGLSLLEPAAAAHDLLALVDRLQPSDTGNFLTRHGEALPW